MVSVKNVLDGLILSVKSNQILLLEGKLIWCKNEMQKKKEQKSALIKKLEACRM